jgi:hypothetical protein
MKTLALVILMAASFTAYAQKMITTATEDSVIVTRDERFDELVRKQKEQNLASPNIEGYRIQIYFGGNRQKASEVKLDFTSRFPGVQAYLTYQQPNFKVRVGDYRNRFDAQKLLKEIDGLYPTAFIVPDEVKLAPLK